MKNSILLKSFLGSLFVALIAFACAKTDDSTTTTTDNTTTTVVGAVGDNASNLVTTALAKSSKFTKGLTVFGVNILATSGVPDAKLLHAANITAELLDNDENGTVDNADVANKLVSLSTYITMYNSDTSEFDTTALVDAGAAKSSGLGANETVDNYADGVSHDAAVEEIFHLITQHGYSNIYPTIFGESNDSTSTMAQYMDVARGSSTPQRCSTAPCTWTYNNTTCPTSGSVASGKAWYFYEDSTADYATMQTEYIYWSVSSNFGMHDSTAGRTKADSEWCPNTKTELEAQDPNMYGLINNSTYAFPTTLPNASYSYYTFKTADIKTF